MHRETNRRNGPRERTARTGEAAWDLTFDERPARWRIGLIVLATDHTTERDFARICPDPELAVYVNRVAYANPTTLENLRGMRPRLAEAAALILPEEPLDAIAYSCTAASLTIGDDEVARALGDSKPGAPCVTPPSAARAAFDCLGLRRISVLTPYTREVSDPFRGYFATHGYEVASLACFGLDDDRMMARVSPSSIVAAACDACHPDAEGLFISCTALRAAEVAQEIEARLGRPVITSNQALIWRSLRIAGYARPITGFGRLLQQG